MRSRAAVLALILVACTRTAAANGQIVEVAATDREIVIRLGDEAKQSVEIRSAGVVEDDATALTRPAEWSGQPEGGTITLPRFDGPVDRLYRRFLIGGTTSDESHSGQYPTNLSQITRSTVELPQPSSVKGLQCITDIDDAILLGVRHAAINVSLAPLFDASGESTIHRDVDGVRVAVREGVLQRLDESVRQMTDAGMRVNLILLNYLPPSGAASSPLVHPNTSNEAPNRIGAFNTTNVEGIRVLRGLIEILAERYSREDARYGLVAGYILGNEVQSHWEWHNQGDASPDDVITDYARAVRIADLAIRRFHPDARVLVSLDHNWTRKHRDEATRSMSGRLFIEQLHAALVAEGDIPWGIAFHPYPENLGDPRTWNDKTATMSFDTPRITFRNLEVLKAFLHQPQWLFQGEPRRLILSEQGFHCPDTPDGETLQAAAFAYAYERVERVGGIESFIYHRHVDHPLEGGLKLGLRENVPGTYDRPGRIRPIYDLFRDIDTAHREKETAFALPVIGIESWEKTAPQAVEPSDP